MKTIFKKSFSAILIFSIASFTQTLNAQCHIDDWTALQAFVKSTDETIFDDWRDLLSPPIISLKGYLDVNLTAPPANCDFSGYFTLDENGRITELTNGGGMLTSCFIPAEISKLTKLETLTLFSFTGKIPDELGDLTNLVNLNIAENKLEGCFGKNLKKLCSQLIDATFYYDFFLSENNFEATWEEFCSTGAGQCNDFSVVDVKSELEVEDGDVFVENSLHGVILKSESSFCFRISVKDDGTLLTNKVSCPGGTLTGN